MAKLSTLKAIAFNWWGSQKPPLGRTRFCGACYIGDAICERTIGNQASIIFGAFVECLLVGVSMRVVGNQCLIGG